MHDRLYIKLDFDIDGEVWYIGESTHLELELYIITKGELRKVHMFCSVGYRLHAMGWRNPDHGEDLMGKYLMDIYTYTYKTWGSVLYT